MSELVLEDQSKLPSGWSFSIIEDIISDSGLFVDGDWVESKDQDPDGDVRLTQLADIGVNTFKNKSNRFMTIKKTNDLNCTFLQKNDVLVARMPDPLGRACLFPEFDQKCVTVVDVAIIRIGKNGCNPKWLMYMINSPLIQSKIFKLQSGTTRKRISRKNLSKILFQIPPIDEQKRIVEKIEELFLEIDYIKKILENNKLQLKQYVKSLLEFTSKGKFTQLWRQEHEHDVESELSIFREFKNKTSKIDSKLISEIHENNLKLHVIPKTWKWVRLGFLSKLITKGASPKWQGIDYVDDGILFITSENVGTGQILLKKPKFLEKKFNEIQKRSILQKGDILTNIVGASIGRTAIYDLDDNANINQAVSLIRTFDEVNRKYIQHILNSQFVLDYMNLEKVDVARANLSLQNVSDFPIPLPPLKEQEQIISKIEQGLSLIKNAENITDSILFQLDTLQGSILKQAFEGKLVPQDPNDEPVEILLQKMKLKKQQLKQKAKKRNKNVK